MVAAANWQVTLIQATADSLFKLLIATPLIGMADLASLPFFIGGGLKLSYDVLLYFLFRAARPPEELPDDRRSAAR